MFIIEFVTLLEKNTNICVPYTMLYHTSKNLPNNKNKKNYE